MLELSNAIFGRRRDSWVIMTSKRRRSIPVSSAVDRRAFPVRLTGFEAIEEVTMPIRIRCRDKSRDKAQPTEDKGISTPIAAVPTAFYAGRKTRLRILCGSV
jgi:hypothetical protein